MKEITELLTSVQEGDHVASNQLFGLLYDELKRIASQQMRKESRGHTLQPTALVHEAFIRLLGTRDSSWENRAHFFGAAAEAMRRILIESARQKNSLKRGGRQQRIDWTESSNEPSQPIDDVLDLNDAITALETEDHDLAQMVKLRFFAGLTMDQIAEVTGTSKSTIERRWIFARAWLNRRLDF